MYLRYNKGIMAKKSEATSKEVAEVDQDRIDRVIWRGIGVKSVRQIAEEAGIKPEEVLRRKGELLDSVDVLSIQEKRQKLVIELDGMARDAREKARNIDSEYYAGTVNAAAGAIKTMLNELARMERGDNSKVEALNQKRISELVSLMREVVDVSVVEIAAKNGLDEQDLYEVFNRRMIEAAEKRDLG